MSILRMDNVAVVVDDLDEAVAFFTELGMELEGRAQIEGLVADRTVGLDGVRSEIAMMRTPDGRSKLELTKYFAPAASRAEPENPPPNTPGIIVALAEQIG
jgi:catechol 2,3-dioxygenase-like lactoylglutathione lyase family enzyme